MDASKDPGPPPGRRIGLIAGNGQFPILVARRAKRQGYSVFAVAHLKETDPALAETVDSIEWIHLGQLKKLIRFFHAHRVGEAAMVGGIRKTRMFTDIRPDLKALALVTGLRTTHDDGILKAVAGLLEKEGVRVRPSTFLLPDLLAPRGCWTRKAPTPGQEADLALGWRIAKEIGRLDIGQCVVTGGGSVLALEAIEGTDATIERGGRLGQGRAVAVKVCKPNQDFRFDLPAVGLRTVETMHRCGVGALAVEAEKAVVFDREDMVALADRCGIALVGMGAEDIADSGPRFAIDAAGRDGRDG